MVWPLPLRIVRIVGDSMWPTLCAGDYAGVVMQARGRGAAVGDVVLVDHPQLGRLVKRLIAESDGRYVLGGDACQSLQPEQMGPVSSSAVLGRVVFSITARGGLSLLRRKSRSMGPNARQSDSPDERYVSAGGQRHLRTMVWLPGDELANVDG